MITIKLKGREIPLIYTVYEMKQVQEEICPLGEISYRILGLNKDNPEVRDGFGGPEQLDALSKMIRIMGNAGLEEAGEAPNLTDKSVLRAMRPTQIPEMVNACSTVIGESLRSEFPDADKDEPTDVVLEELKKKEPKES